MEQMKQDHLSDLNLKMENDTKNHLHTAAKWGKFIAVMVFIGAGLVLVFGIASVNSLIDLVDKYFPEIDTTQTVGVFIGLVVFMILIFVVNYYFLFQFGMNMKKGLHEENEEKISYSLRSLKIFFMLATVISALLLIVKIYGMFNSN